MLAGLLRDEGDVQWMAISNRRPAINPIDKLDPRGALNAYRDTSGKTMVLLGKSNRELVLVELETGKEISRFGSNGIDQMRGEMPIHWETGNNMEGNGICYLFVIDPSREQPRLIFRMKGWLRDLPEAWIKAQPLYDVAQPEFQGVFIASIVEGGYLWLLKREAESPAEFEKNDPEGFRLVRVSLDGGNAVSIPLTYQVPESIRKMGASDQPAEQSSLERPIINARSLTSTPRGLFFASSGYGADLRWYGDQLNGGDVAPVLLYITWDDICAWLAKNVEDPSKPPSSHTPTSTERHSPEK